MDLIEHLAAAADRAAGALLLAAQFAGGDIGQQRVGIGLAGVPAAVGALHQNLGLHGALPL